jgi:hypothetical protein
VALAGREFAPPGSHEPAEQEPTEQRRAQADATPEPVASSACRALGHVVVWLARAIAHPHRAADPKRGPLPSVESCLRGHRAGRRLETVRDEVARLCWTHGHGHHRLLGEYPCVGVHSFAHEPVLGERAPSHRRCTAGHAVRGSKRSCSGKGRTVLGSSLAAAPLFVPTTSWRELLFDGVPAAWPETLGLCRSAAELERSMAFRRKTQ